MNILIMNSVAVDSWGGGEKWMLTTGAGLRERGHNIYVSGREGSIFLDRAAEYDFPLMPLTIKSDFSIPIILKLARFFKEKQIDVALVNFHKEVKLAGMAAKISRNPLVIPMNGLAILHNNWRYRMTFKFFADGIMTITGAIKDKYMTYGWLEDDYVRAINNCIETDVALEYDHEKTRTAHNLPSKFPTIGIFGRLVKQKQHTYFLEVAKNILEKYPETVFIVVGEGPERDRIQQYAKELGIWENIHMLGMQKKVYEYYTLCDLILSTSEDEGLPFVILEAMSVERPVIAFNVGGIIEAIPNDSVGIVVPPNDKALMTEKALELLKDGQKRLFIGKAAREFVQENFSMKTMIDKTEAYLNELRTRRS